MHGENTHAGSVFFMARWDMSSVPVCTALFTILGGAENRKIGLRTGWAHIVSIVIFTNNISCQASLFES